MLSLVRRRRAVMNGLRRLREIACHPATFAEYGGHLLLAFAQLATTSRRTALRRAALEAGRERARVWHASWPEIRGRLDADAVLNEVIASYAAERMGLPDDAIRSDLQAVIGGCSAAALLYFDPRDEPPPSDIPAECKEGHTNCRGVTSCTVCGDRLAMKSRYEIWHFALTGVYFCEESRLRLGVRYGDVLQYLPALRPYPQAGDGDYYHSIYAVTHLIYTLNGYGASCLSREQLTREWQFLEISLAWAIAQGEVDTVAEVAESLVALGLSDEDGLLKHARALLLQWQHDDGGWGDEIDGYRCFHNVWAALDGLREFAWVEPADQHRWQAFLSIR
jgi:hypothetical protein